MTKQEWKELIKENREEIEEVLKEAFKTSYENHNLCNVIITTDGKPHIFEDVSHGGESYVGEYLMIAKFDNPFNSPIDDYFDDVDVLLETYEENLSEEERKAYDKAVAEFESDGNKMDVYERNKWIYENCKNAASAVYEYAWNELCSGLDFDEIISNALTEELR